VTSFVELAVADLVLVVDAAEITGDLPATLPRISICTPANGACDSLTSHALLAMAGEAFPLCEEAVSKRAASAADDWDWLTAAPLLARLARAILLRGTSYGMAAWEESWGAGRRSYSVGARHDPTAVRWGAEVNAQVVDAPTYRTPPLRQGTLMIVGLGSLGSVAAERLAPWVKRMILVDPDHVEPVNLIRQAYSHSDVGKPKASALAQSFMSSNPGLECVPLVASLTEDREVTELLQHYGVTAALVTTGTQADFAIARALRLLAIPHVVGRCYPRGRFWEGIVVDGAAGASYEQMRRGVAAGPLPAPTLEELLRYGAVGDLVGEPATAMETGWAAMWLARLTAQMLVAVTLREGWLLARLAADASCFIGGVGVEKVREEMTEKGALLEVKQGVTRIAYGISVPGQVHAWSNTQIGT
jgi:hypothetical protein